jgi:TRAP-type C4-dicarboxylate transport system substrate-binding protein
LSWIHVTRKTVFTSNEKPIVGPEDFNGLTIVALNEFSEKPFEAVGADPVLVYSPDVYDAVTSGAANAIMTDVSSATGLKFYEIQKYATVAPFFSAYYHLFVSPDWLAGLSTQNRKAVLDAAKQLNIDSFLITEARAAASPDVLREGGMIVHEQTADEQEAWKRVMSQPSMEAFLESSPDSSRLISLLDDI